MAPCSGVSTDFDLATSMGSGSAISTDFDSASGMGSGLAMTTDSGLAASMGFDLAHLRGQPMVRYLGSMRLRASPRPKDCLRGES